MKIMELYDKLDANFHGAYWRSWVGHALTFFLCGSLGALLNINPLLFIGAGIGQELTHLTIYRSKIKYYDYILDFISDLLGIGLAYLIF